MSMFSKLLKKSKKEVRADEERERECMQAIGAVLQAYHCRIDPVLKGDARSIYADVQITALPKPPHAPGRAPDAPAGSNAQPASEAVATPKNSQ
jgi:hypothetical protein